MESADIILVRHGETEWNRKGLIQGHEDSRLTEQGISQADATGERLKEVALKALLSSDAGRAIETARRIGKPHGLTPEIIPELRERGFGDLEGLTMDQVREQFGGEVPQRLYNELDFDAHGVESIRQFERRVIRAIKLVSESHRGQTIVVVTHGGSLNRIFRHAVGLDALAPRQFELRNCSINRIRVSQDSWTLSTWGDSLHLPQMNSDEAHS